MSRSVFEEFLKIVGKPPTQACLVDLYCKLSELKSKEKKVVKVIQTLQSFNIRDEDPLSDKQWEEIRRMIGPERNQVHLSRLNSELIMAVTNLMTALSLDRMYGITSTLPVLNYFELAENDPETRLELLPIREVLEDYGWTDGGFVDHPDLKAIIWELQSLFV